jgi:hypothetical protein
MYEKLTASLNEGVVQSMILTLNRSFREKGAREQTG